MSPSTIDGAYSSIAFFRCTNCAFLFSPNRSSKQLEQRYSDDYFEDFHGGGSYAADARQRRFEAKRRLAWVRRHRHTGRLLEIGSANGVFLDTARSAGFAVSGVEPVGSYAARAREDFGLDVRTGFVDSVNLPEGRFEVICAFHVLEHLPAPQATFMRLRGKIADDGLMFLEFPNIESLRARKHLTNWFHLDPLNHVGFYDPEQLAKLLKEADLELVEIHTVSSIIYQRPLQTLKPVNLALRAYDTVTTRRLQSRPDPTRFEFFRAVARPRTKAER